MRRVHQMNKNTNQGYKEHRNTINTINNRNTHDAHQQSQKSITGKHQKVKGNDACASCEWPFIYLVQLPVRFVHLLICLCPNAITTRMRSAHHNAVVALLCFLLIHHFRFLLVLPLLVLISVFTCAVCINFCICLMFVIDAQISRSHSFTAATEENSAEEVITVDTEGEAVEEEVKEETVELERRERFVVETVEDARAEATTAGAVRFLDVILNVRWSFVCCVCVVSWLCLMSSSYMLSCNYSSLSAISCTVSCYSYMRMWFAWLSSLFAVRRTVRTCATNVSVPYISVL